MKTKIWTIGYFPFAIGGGTHKPILCEVEAEDLYAIGKDQKAYLVKAPNGDTFVAESVTGAIVGNDIHEVIKDINSASYEVIKNQIKEAKKVVKKAEEISSDEFWKLLKC